MRVRLVYRTEGKRTEQTFRTIEQARRWMYQTLGPAPTPCEPFGFVANGDDVVIPLGCSIRQLMGKGKRRGP